MPSEKSTQHSRGDQAADSKVEIITPLKVRLPGSRSDFPSSPQRRPVIVILTLLLVLSGMVAGGFLIIRHLSNDPPDLIQNQVKTSAPQVPGSEQTSPPLTSKPSAQNPPDQQVAAEPEQTIDPTKLAQEKQTAEDRLGAYLKLKNQLEEKNASEWGGEKYQTMIALAGEADSLLMQNIFPAAAEKYIQAGRKAAEIADSSEAVFEQLLAEGLQAIENGNAVIAVKNFRTALMIDPASESARRYLARAEQIDSVKRLIDSGRNHEKNNQLAFALADYQAALKLDPESTGAAEDLLRVKEKIVTEQFQVLMSQGLTALHQGNYQLARTRLLKARNFRPESDEVAAALQQVDDAIRLDKISKLHRQAQTAEQEENWPQALNSYLAVLKIDPNIGFAVQGKERALTQIQIAKRINFFLRQPDILASNQQLQNATLVIKEAEVLQPRGQRFNAALQKLKLQVEAARTPVSVMIESDNLTDIAVYKVGKLGRFSSRELSLRPGTYTVVGTRDGYQDVRLKIIVKPGQKTVRVSIICKDSV